MTRWLQLPKGEKVTKDKKIKCPAVEQVKKVQEQKEREKKLSEENLKKYKELTKGLH